MRLPRLIVLILEKARNKFSLHRLPIEKHGHHLNGTHEEWQNDFELLFRVPILAKEIPTFR